MCAGDALWRVHHADLLLRVRCGVDRRLVADPAHTRVQPRRQHRLQDGDVLTVQRPGGATTAGVKTYGLHQLDQVPPDVLKTTASGVTYKIDFQFSPASSEDWLLPDSTDPASFLPVLLLLGLNWSLMTS